MTPVALVSGAVGRLGAAADVLLGRRVAVVPAGPVAMEEVSLSKLRDLVDQSAEAAGLPEAYLRDAEGLRLSVVGHAIELERVYRDGAWTCLERGRWPV